MIYPIKFRWLIHQIDCGGSCTKTSHAFTRRKRPTLCSSCITVPPPPPCCRASPQCQHASDGVGTSPRWLGLRLVPLCNCKRRGAKPSKKKILALSPGKHNGLIYYFMHFLSSAHTVSSDHILSSRDKLEPAMGFRPTLMEAA